MTRKKTKKMLEADRALIEADNAKVAAERAELIVNSPVFEQPKGDTPLARAMSIPWVADGIEPEIRDDGTGCLESNKLLLWVKGYGPEFGKRIKGSHSGNLKWIIHGYRGDFEITHWAYITEPK
jgi:hypothetical protein